jgi:hypothetical protein
MSLSGSMQAALNAERHAAVDKIIASHRATLSPHFQDDAHMAFFNLKKLHTRYCSAPSATAADIMRYLAPIIGGPDSAGAWKIFVDTLRAHPHAALGDAQAASPPPIRPPAPPGSTPENKKRGAEAPLFRCSINPSSDIDRS